MNYFPEPGDTVNLTVRATFDGNAYIVTDDRDEEVFSTAPGSSYEVAVEPAPVDLPSTPFAVIRADLKGGTTDEVLSLSSPTHATGWTDSAGGWYSGDRITRVHEILFPGVPS